MFIAKLQCRILCIQLTVKSVISDGLEGILFLQTFSKIVHGQFDEK